MKSLIGSVVKILARSGDWGGGGCLAGEMPMFISLKLDVILCHMDILNIMIYDIISFL